MINKARKIKPNGDWITNTKWDWYGNLTFEEPITRKEAFQRFSFWKDKLEGTAGSQIEYILVIEEHEDTGSIPHLNVLISGIKNEIPSKWLDEWILVDGIGQLMRYHTGQGAMHYIARKLRDKNAEVIFSKGRTKSTYI